MDNNQARQIFNGFQNRTPDGIKSMNQPSQRNNSIPKSENNDQLIESQIKKKLKHKGKKNKGISIELVESADKQMISKNNGSIYSG